jgi:hypothetical protein
MSHISKKQRSILDVSTVINCTPKSSDELSYTIMRLINNYIKDEEGNTDKSKFKKVVGTLENVKFDFQNNFVVPEESQNKFDNGEVY